MMKLKVTLLLFAFQIYLIYYVQNYIRKQKDDALDNFTVRKFKKRVFKRPKTIEFIQGSNDSFLYESLEKEDPRILDILHSRSVRVSELCRPVNSRHKIADTNSWNVLQVKTLKKALRSLLIIPDNNLIWCLVPKVASTSLSNAIIQANNLTALIKDRKQPQLFLQKFYKDAYQKLLNKTSSSFTSFYITRHPFERLVSAYRNKFENSSFHDWEYFNRVFGAKILSRYRYKELMDKDPDLWNNTHREEPTFKEFVKFLLTTVVGSYDHHWKPISLLCDVCSFKYDYVLRYENFEVEFDVFQTHLRNKKMLPPDFATKWHNRGTADKAQRENITKTYMKKLPQAYINSLNQRFKSDFEYFGYDATDYSD